MKLREIRAEGFADLADEFLRVGRVGERTDEILGDGSVPTSSMMSTWLIGSKA